MTDTEQVPPQQPGITDEAAMEEHDLISRVETEEHEKHGDEGMLGETTDKGEAPHWKKNASSSSSGDTTAQASSDKKESAIDKLKNTLNMK